MKDKILQKAADMFLSLGFKSVTMDDIASELGMSKKTIYSHFSTKRKLVEASTFYVLDRVNETICSILDANYDPIEETFTIKSMVALKSIHFVVNKPNHFPYFAKVTNIP